MVLIVDWVLVWSAESSTVASGLSVTKDDSSNLTCISSSLLSDYYKELKLQENLAERRAKVLYFVLHLVTCIDKYIDIIMQKVHLPYMVVSGITLYKVPCRWTLQFDQHVSSTNNWQFTAYHVTWGNFFLNINGICHCWLLCCDQADDLTCELQCIMREGLAVVVETEMRAAYDDLWYVHKIISGSWYLRFCFRFSTRPIIKFSVPFA